MPNLLNQVYLRRFKRRLAKINRLSLMMKKLTDAELQAYTPRLQAKIAAGVQLDELIELAFAVVREADRRVLGLYPYDVQVLGALALQRGMIAEMKTGEGKTLTATMPLYLNALTGRGAMLVTPNEYLAERDGKEMGQVYRWLGLNVAVGFPTAEHPAKNGKELSPTEKRMRYQADIVYTTNAMLGFDYLIDHLASRSANQFYRQFDYCIVDEADAVLLDTAVTPLVISGTPRVNSNYLGPSDEVIRMLVPSQDYHFDEEEKAVWLTPKGIQRVERFFSQQHLYDGDHDELIKWVTLALKAHVLLERDRDYVVTPSGEVTLLDRTNGRLLPGMKLNGGLHQALEMKEQVKISDDQRAVATITYQNLFRQFKHLAGMTGTAQVDAEEFSKVYNLAVCQLPTNKPMIRRDYPDQLYVTLPEKIMASLTVVKQLHATGRPVLLVTGSVEVSEIYSELLLQAQIPHSVLNAKNAAKEATIIKEAGQQGAVTVATSMAGRGTDIQLGPGVAELGGLAVIGTEKMASQRIDQQLRGRAGRQGDPGSSQFFVSLEDPVVQHEGAHWLRRYFEQHRDQMTNRPLKGWRYHQAVRQAQIVSDEHGAQQRRQALLMDESSHLQRRVVYHARQQLLQGDLQAFDLKKIMTSEFQRFYRESQPLTPFKLARYIRETITYQFEEQPQTEVLAEETSVVHYLHQIAEAELARKRRQFKRPSDESHFYRLAILKAIDGCWMDEVDSLEQLRQAVVSRAVAQRNPIAEYHRKAYRAFQQMQVAIRRAITKNVLLSQLVDGINGKQVIYFD